MDGNAGAVIIGLSAFLSMFVLVCVCRRRIDHPPESVIAHVPDDPGDPEPVPPR